MPRSSTLVLLSMALIGCGASAPLAADAGQVPVAQAVDSDAESYDLDPTTTIVEADVQAMTSHTLHFKASGKLVISPHNPLATSLDVAIDATSAEASLAVVGDVAKSGHFLDVGAYPTAHFTSLAFAKGATGEIELFGEIELHGTKRSIRVPATVKLDACTVEVTTAFALNRHEYHVDSDGSVDGVVGDTVVIRIGAHPPRAARPASCDAPQG